MAGPKKSVKRVKKEAFWERLQHVAQKYKNCLFIDANNVSSQQIQKIRMRLRDIDAYMIMGKNTLMKAALQELNEKPENAGADWKPNADLEKIVSQLRLNTNLIFTNGDLSAVKEILDMEVRPSPAKAGMIAPDDVFIPAGPTGLDPKQTSFFQNLGIQTKIVKAQIEIQSNKQVIFTGEKINGTQALLLDKLKIYPFEYKMNVTKILQDGAIFDARVLSLDNNAILSKFKGAIKKQAALSFGIGYTTQASVAHSIANTFKKMAAVCAESGYSFPQAAKLLEAAKNAPAAGAAGATAEAAPVVEEKKEEEEAVDMGGLFGDDEDEY
jgi:large subunit ribosomal protein LP0